MVEIWSQSWLTVFPVFLVKDISVTVQSYPKQFIFIAFVCQLKNKFKLSWEDFIEEYHHGAGRGAMQGRGRGTTAVGRRALTGRSASISRARLKMFLL